MLSRIILVLSALGVLILAACNGGGTTTVVTTPTPGPTCGPVGITSQLVYPVPGSTAVPDTTSMIAIAVSPSLTTNVYDLVLNWPNNQSVTYNNLVTISQSQLPPGSATATISNPTYMEVQLINPLPSATQITSLAINNQTTDTTNCTPQTIPNSSFTTQ